MKGKFIDSKKAGKVKFINSKKAGKTNFKPKPKTI